MTFALPTPNNLHELSRDTSGPGQDPRFLANINSPSNPGVKPQGNLPITLSAKEYDNNANNTTKGYACEFQASQASWDVSSDTKVMLWHNQHNAPNRIQVDNVAGGGHRIRIYSGTGSPPSTYKEYYLGGNDTPNGECCKGQYPYTIDLNDTSNDASSGTFDNTAVTSYAMLIDRLNLAGTSTSWNYNAKLYVLDTTKSSSSTPTFSGSGASILDAVTLIQGTTYTNKLGNWVRKIGSVIFIDMPFRIGNNSTVTTFDDEGYTVISPKHNDTNDPRVRVTVQAFRVYLNLRNNAADTATFSGTWVWQVRSLFDFDQDDSAAVTFSSPTFKGMGEFTLGSSITGPATWDDVDAVIFADTGVDVDGSTFKNPNGNHALEMTAGAMDIEDMRFESYTGKHAILIDTAGTYNFSNVYFDESGTNEVETTHASGVVTINITNGGTVPGVTVTGAGTVEVNNNVTVKVTVKDASALTVVSGARVLLHADTGGSLPFEDSVTITRSGSTATVTHTAHGLKTGDKVWIKGANEQEYNGVFSITVATVNTYTYTVTGTPSTPATGTIDATYVILDGTTDGTGVIQTTTFNYSAAQPVAGKVRKGTATPRYKEAPLTGSVSASGFDATAFVVGDE